MREVVQSGDHERAAQTETLRVRVDADHVDLPLPGWIRVQLGPAEPDEIVAAPRQEEPRGIEPGLRHPALQHLGDPTALIGVIRERTVVDSEPRRFVATRNEGVDDNPIRPPRGLGDWQNDVELELAPIDGESAVEGERLDHVGVRPRDPGDQLMIRTSGVQHRVHGSSDSSNGDARERTDRQLVVRRSERAGGKRNGGRAAIGVDRHDRVARRICNRSPDRFREGFMSTGVLDRTVDGAQTGLVGARRGNRLNEEGHRVRRYLPRMARPRGAKQRSAVVLERLEREYPGTATELCALRHDTPFQLLAATILSAQCTDEMVNAVTPKLFERFPGPDELAEADPAEVEVLVHATGFFRQKTKSLIGMATAVRDRFGGEVPTELDDLVRLPGVGRKTGNVLRSVAFDLPGLPVDTHVGRLSTRLKLTSETDPVKVELDLNGLIPPEARGGFSLRLILHGRRVCGARRPRCEDCVLADICPSAGRL